MNGETLNGPSRRGAQLKFFGIISLVFSLFLALPSLYEIQQATQARDWLPRQALIEQSEVAVWESGRGDRQGPRYRARISGTLLDSGRSFKLERIAFAQFSTRADVEHYVKRYPAGEKARVFVSPDDPTRVVLARDADVDEMYLLIGAGAALIIGGLFSYAKGRRIKPRDAFAE